MWLRRGTPYAVTDKHILIARELPFPRFTALDIATSPKLILWSVPTGVALMIRSILLHATRS
jgi:hypothetical protein